MRQEVDNPLIFELSVEGRVSYSLPELDVPEVPVADLIPANYVRQTPANLPEMAELDLVRHFTKLSKRNHGVDDGFYPLGSCTMKYNPKRNERAARIPGFAQIHPLQPQETVQGALELLYNLQTELEEITGMDEVSLQPAAGAHGEWTGLMMIRAYHEQRGEKRTTVIVPDSAHGTNPASATVAGYKTVTVKSNDKGGVDLEALRAVVNQDTAALMLTNPSTLGLFEDQIIEIAEIVHEAGGLLYYDGANANAILGYARPGDMGFDVVHLNLHKTFTTPHGGGGPGAGPVGVKKELIPYLPKPRLEKQGDQFVLNWDRPDSIGKVKGFWGNFGILVRAYTYIRTMGPDGLKRVTEDAVLNANYMMRRLEPHFDLPYNQICKHEFVLSGRRYKKEYGVKTLDIAKRLLDFGVHPPTIYFPLNVEEAIMIEPTETENLETLDGFCDMMIQIANEAKETPDLVKNAPHSTKVNRLDETTAARNPVLRFSWADKL